MQPLIFVIVLLISTIVSSTKCKNPALKCIELCCKESQFYAALYETCFEIPDDGIGAWLAFLHDNETISETMEFVEHGKCNGSSLRNVYIPSCYSPYYPEESSQFDLKEFTDVQCNRYRRPPGILPVIASVVCLCSLPICLPIMIVYTCRQGLQHKFTYQLVSWYLVSMVAFFVAIFVILLRIALSKGLQVDTNIHECIGLFLFTATFLWQHVIGFQIWSAYKAGDVANNSDQDRRRFIYYSIYVWGIASIITGSYYLLSRKNWISIMDRGIGIAITCYNLLTFLILSVNICITRCRVINLVDEAHFKRNLAIIVLRLGLMMGLPRILIFTLDLYVEVSEYVAAYFIILEPYVVFTVLVWKPKNHLNCNFVCCCCKKSVETPNAEDNL